MNSDTGCKSTRLPPITTTRTTIPKGSLLLARGLPDPEASGRSTQQPNNRDPYRSSLPVAAAEAYVKACGGRAAFAGCGGSDLPSRGGAVGHHGRGILGEDLQDLLWFRSSPCALEDCSSSRNGINGPPRGSATCHLPALGDESYTVTYQTV